MSRFSQELFALLTPPWLTHSSATEGLEREPLYKPPTASPAQIALWGKGRIVDVAWSPNGHQLAIGSALGIDIYDARTFEQQYRISAAKAVEHIMFLEDNTSLATISDEALNLWHIQDGLLMDTVATFVRPPLSVAFSANAALVALDTGEAIHVHQVDDGALLYRLPTYTAGMQGNLAFSPDGRLLAVATGLGLQLWQIQNQELIDTLGEGVARVGNVAFTVDGRALITFSDREILLWDIPNSGPPRTLVSDMSGIQRIALSRDGHFLAAAADTDIHIWRLEDGLWMRALQSHKTQTQSLAFDADSQLLLAASSDALQVWRVADGSEMCSLSGYCGSVTSVAYAADGRTFAAMAGQAQLWQRKHGNDKVLHHFELERRVSQTSGCAFSHNGAHLALATDAQIQIRRTDNGQLLALVENGLAQGDALAFSEDGRHLLTVSPDAVHVWRVPDGTLLTTLWEEVADAYAVVLAPDGQTLAAVRDQIIQIWSVSDGSLLGELNAMLDINGIALARSGRALAVATDDAIQIWQADPIEQYYTVEAGAQRLVFDATGERLASAKDSTIQIWNVRDGALLCTLKGHTDCVSSMAFSHDGRKLISGSHDGTVRLWDCRREI